jgi:hypothetical protein
MLRTIVRPHTGQIQLDIPPEYVGKEIEITYLPLEELNKGKDTQSKKTMKDFWGVLSDTAAARLHEHVAKSREEWERNI